MAVYYGDVAVASCYDKRATIIKDCIGTGEKVSDTCAATTLILIMKGRLSISAAGSFNQTLCAGKIVMLPAGCFFTMSAEEDSVILVYGIESIVEMWEGGLPSAGRGNLLNNTVPHLVMNERLRDYAEGVSAYLTDGISDAGFIRMKTFELMHLLQFYYTEEELENFMVTVANVDLKFMRIVMENWDNVRSKAELAAIAGLSPSRFGVKFKEVFGESPYQWMITRKSEKIYYRLVYGNDSLKKISEDFRFGSIQHFNDFCKKQFGITPGKLRDRNRKPRNTDSRG